MRAGAVGGLWSAIARRFGRSSHRHGVTTAPDCAAAEFSRRYEWTEPGALLHMDAKRAAEVFVRPGHWAHGDRSEIAANPQRRQRQRDRRHRRPHPARLRRTALVRERASGRRRRCARAAAWFVEQGCGPVRGGHERQRDVYATATPSATLLSRPRRPPHPHPAPHTPLERQNRALLPEPSTPNGHTAASGPTTPDATAPWQASSASTTAADHTSACGGRPPSAAFTNSASRTTRPSAAPSRSRRRCRRRRA